MGVSRGGRGEGEGGFDVGDIGEDEEGEGVDSDDDDGVNGDGKQVQVPVTLLSSPAGWPVYQGLGFEGLENVTVEMLDGLGELWFEVCRWDG